MKPSDIIDLVQTIKIDCADMILIFDNIFFFEKLWADTSWTFLELARRIRIDNPRVTIIATQRKETNKSLWSSIISIVSTENKYCMDGGENRLVGHLAKISGPIGSSVIYIDHLTGRISKAFEHVRLSVEAGEKTTNSVFELDKVRAQGAWNFVFESGKSKRCIN